MLITVAASNIRHHIFGRIRFHWSDQTFWLTFTLFLMIWQLRTFPFYSYFLHQQTRMWTVFNEVFITQTRLLNGRSEPAILKLKYHENNHLIIVMHHQKHRKQHGENDTIFRYRLKAKLNIRSFGWQSLHSFELLGGSWYDYQNQSCHIKYFHSCALSSRILQYADSSSLTRSHKPDLLKTFSKRKCLFFFQSVIVFSVCYTLSKFKGKEPNQISR